MSNNRKKVRRWLLLIVWMIVIFIMSQQPGDISTKQSDFVVAVFELMGLDLNTWFGDLATFVVRKGAHFSEYCILFILAWRVISLYFYKNKAKIISVGFVFLYACSDEFHQLFVAGRSGAFRDVLIDTSGGMFACLILVIFEIIKLKKGIDSK